MHGNSCGRGTLFIFIAEFIFVIYEYSALHFLMFNNICQVSSSNIVKGQGKIHSNHRQPTERAHESVYARHTMTGNSCRRGTLFIFIAEFIFVIYDY